VNSADFRSARVSISLDESLFDGGIQVIREIKVFFHLTRFEVICRKMKKKWFARKNFFVNQVFFGVVWILDFQIRLKFLSVCSNNNCNSIDFFGAKNLVILRTLLILVTNLINSYVSYKSGGYGCGDLHFLSGLLQNNLSPFFVQGGPFIFAKRKMTFNCSGEFYE
jgi:hypothetical protein